MNEFLSFLEVVLGFLPVMAGGAVAFAALIDGAKKLGILPDGYAQLVSLVLNAALFVALHFLGDKYGSEIQSVLDGVASVSPIIVTLLLALGGTKIAHKVLLAIGLGYSHENEPVG